MMRRSTPILTGYAQRMLEGLRCAAALVDGAGVVIAANASWHESRGVPGMPAADVGDSLVAAFCVSTPDRPPNDAARTGLRSVLSGDAADFRLDLESPSHAGPVWLRLSIERLDPGVGGAVVRIEDTTVMHLAHDAIRAAGPSREAVLPEADELITINEADGTLRWISPSVERMLGWTVDDLVGTNSFALVHPDDAEALLARNASDVQAPGPSPAVTFRMRTKRGAYRLVEATLMNLLDHPSVRGLVVTAYDVTDKARADELVVASETRLRGMVDGLLDPCVLMEAVFDETGHVIDFSVVDANPAAGAFHGVPREALLGKRILAAAPVTMAKTLLDLYSVVAEQGTPLILDDYVHEPHRSGQDGRRYDIRAVPVGGGVSVVWRDVTERHTAQQEIRASEERYRLLAENSSDVVLQVALDDTYVWASPSIRDTLGWRPEEVVGRSAADFVHAEDLARLVAERTHFVEGRAELSDFRVRCSDGTFRWCSAVTRQVFDSAGVLLGRVVALRDVHDRTIARRALVASEQVFRTAMQSAAIGMALTDLSGTFQVVNQALCELLQRDEAWLIAHGLGEVLHPDDVAAVRGKHAAMLDGSGDSVVAHQRLIRADGATVWTRAAVVLIRDESGDPDFLMIQLEDVTAEHEAREALAYQAFHDPLTGLRNRAWVLDMLDVDLRSATRTGSAVGVLFIDLDNFKIVNDSLGHPAGDEVLRSVATRIERVLRPRDRVGRFGGDEFVVVVPDVADPGQVERVAERIVAAVGTDLVIQGHRIVPTASIGIALSTPASTPSSLLRDTDAALFRAKAAGRSRWQFFDDAMHAHAVSRLTIEDEMRRSLEARDFVVHYQPIVTLGDGTIAGYEALVRWQHPSRGLLGPAEFLSAAEDSGLIADIGQQVLDQVCALLAISPDVPGRISVNISAVQFGRSDWLDSFAGTLARHGVDPARLVVEVTETAVLSLLAGTRADLGALRALGVGVHVDDFGTGFSSISLLRDLPVTGLKLDASFVADLSEADSAANALSAGLAGLVEGLGLVGIAEGVETTAQARILRGHGWTHGQGYLWGRPAPSPVRWVAEAAPAD